jgi:hypothetical protein
MSKNDANVRSRMPLAIVNACGHSSQPVARRHGSTDLRKIEVAHPRGLSK